MLENVKNFFKKFGKNEKENSKSTAKERLHLVLAQDRANISADFLEMMKQEIIEVIKKYIDIDEEAIDVRMTNKPGEDGTVGAPALYANIPIVTIKNDARKLNVNTKPKEEELEHHQEDILKEEDIKIENVEEISEDNRNKVENYKGYTIIDEVQSEYNSKEENIEYKEEVKNEEKNS